MIRGSADVTPALVVGLVSVRHRRRLRRLARSVREHGQDRENDAELLTPDALGAPHREG